MTALFLDTVNLSISALWLVLAVLLVRLVLKKAPKWVHVLLWGIVAARLIFPFSIESALSLIPSAQTIPPAVLTEPSFEIQSGIPPVDNRVNEYLGDHYYQGVTAPVGQSFDVMTLLTVIWLAGIAVLVLYTLISYLRLRLQVRTAVRYRGNIYQSETVTSPFILGIFRPRIYLPFRMDAAAQSHVIAHEEAHLRRRDHWWKPLGFLLLAVHWFNPALWLAYVLLCRDIEMACDEKVIRELGTDARADYSQALLQCSINRRSIAACPLAFGEVGVKDRVKSVLNYKKPAFWVILIALLVCIAVAVCFLTDPLNPTDRLCRVEDSTEGIHATYDLTLGNQATGGTVWMEHWEDGVCIRTFTYHLTPEMEQIKISLDYTENDPTCYVHVYSDLEGMATGEFTCKWGDIQDICCAYQELGTNLEVAPGSRRVLAWFQLQSTSEDRTFEAYEDLSHRLTWGSHIVIRASFHDDALESSYNVDQLTFQAEDAPTTCTAGDNTPDFAIQEGDTGLVLKAREADTREWTELGLLQPLVLTKANFDDLCGAGQWTGWGHHYDPMTNTAADFIINASYLREAVQSWKLTADGVLYYVIQSQDENIYVAKGTEEAIHWIFRLRESQKDAPAQGYYVSERCLYVDGWTTINPWSEDAGLLYEIGEHSITCTQRTPYLSSKSDPSFAYGGIVWEWEDFPYTDEEWEALGGTPGISGYYGEMLYQPLDDPSRFLLQMDGELWMVRLAGIGDQPQLSSIYTLVPQYSHGKAEWTYNALTSPRYAIRFHGGGDAVLAYAQEGTLYRDIWAGNPVTAASGGTVYWSPVAADGTRLESDEIYIRFSGGGEGTLYLTAQGDTYTAEIVGTGLYLNEYGTVSSQVNTGDSVLAWDSTLRGFRGETPVQLHWFPDATLFVDGDTMYVQDEYGTTVLTEEHLTGRYLKDLNGDGLPELCIGHRGELYRTTVVDYAHRVLYTLQDGVYQYYLSDETDALVVQQQDESRNTLATGTLSLRGDTLELRDGNGNLLCAAQGSPFPDPLELAPTQALEWFQNMAFQTLPGVTFLYQDGQFGIRDQNGNVQLLDPNATQGWLMDRTTDGIQDCCLNCTDENGKRYVVIVDYVNQICHTFRDGEYVLTREDGDLTITRYDDTGEEVTGTLFWTGKAMLMRSSNVTKPVATAEASGLVQTLDAPATQVAWVGWNDDPVLTEAALNRELLTSGSDRLPVYRCSSPEDVSQFRQTMDGVLRFDVLYSQNPLSSTLQPSLDAVLKQYDGAFFLFHDLLLVYVTAPSGSFRYDLAQMELSHGTLRLLVTQTNDPEICTDDMAGWIIAVPVDKDLTQSIDTFDAILK